MYQSFCSSNLVKLLASYFNPLTLIVLPILALKSLFNFLLKVFTVIFSNFKNLNYLSNNKLSNINFIFPSTRFNFLVDRIFFVSNSVLIFKILFFEL